MGSRLCWCFHGHWEVTEKGCAGFILPEQSWHLSLSVLVSKHHLCVICCTDDRASSARYQIRTGPQGTEMQVSIFMLRTAYQIFFYVVQKQNYQDNTYKVLYVVKNASNKHY